ncbi:MAG TPA: 2-phospho-L-lactate transferase [Methylomirabilota bacterium]|nr:2-phospho-L-lactate transferase [Methylomirabilota bacterium]
MKVTAIAGGTGAAKLLRGLVTCLAPRDLTVIGNTGDDAEVWGLHVSPDLDTTTYALAGRLDTERGWGLAGETFRCLGAMAELGAETWFNLGDRDLATHLARTAALRAGTPLSMVTADIARSLGVDAGILPMSDDPVRTRIRVAAATASGDDWLTFQEYFVREKALMEVLEVAYAGAPQARPAPGVVAAIAEAELIVICPSNPVTSIGPVLAVPGIPAALTAARAPIVGVSPIISGAAVSGPAARLMRSRSMPVSPVGVAQAYAPWLGVLLIDPGDRACIPALLEQGVSPVLAEILMPDREREVALARRVLEAAGA